ncbi:MAG: hypothetical protein ACR2I1_10040 [Propionibacteriaceae bacterium]
MKHIDAGLLVAHALGDDAALCTEELHHLAVCGRCLQEVEELRHLAATGRLLSADDQLVQPAAVVWDRIRAGLHPQPAGSGRRRPTGGAGRPDRRLRASRFPRCHRS